MAIPLETTAPQDTRLSDALGQQYDRITEFLNRNVNPGPNPTEIGRAALSSAFTGSNYQQSISDLVANRQQNERSNIEAQGSALDLLVKRNELLASQGHPVATALQDALKTVGFSNWDPQQQQSLLKAIDADPEQMNESNALAMVMRHSSGVDLTPPVDYTADIIMGPDGQPMVNPLAIEAARAKAAATRTPREDNLVQVMVGGVPTWVPESQAAGMPVGSTGNQGMEYTGQGTIELPNGSYTLGRFNKDTGDYEVQSTDEGGNAVWVPAPPGSKMVTQTSMSDTKPTANQFYETQQKVVNDRNSLINLNRFMNNIGDMEYGYKQLGNQFLGLLKTVTGNQNLTKEELATLEMNGQLQTLLGQNRLAIVGGGVMTEYDAQRVIGAILGSAPGGIINPQVVADNIRFLFDQKMQNYSAAVMTYNNMVKSGQQRGDALYTGLPTYDPNEIKFNLGGGESVPDWAQ